MDNLTVVQLKAIAKKTRYKMLLSTQKGRVDTTNTLEAIKYHDER